MDAVVDGVSLERALSAPQPSVHLLPCAINTDGPCKVDQYFNTTFQANADSDKLTDFTASFRGRPLRGEDITLPHGFTAIILREDKKPLTDKQSRHFNVQHSFKTFRYWNLDKPTSGDDTIRKALDWLTLSVAVHSPVNSEDTDS
ncbi:ribonuclease H2 subunit C-like [Corticium candelabrum]|uniref:ribonuclease H2 subunit C-like n=1 Tax=Corticium candelabrum TaxID=121492 RepID=UPI002E26D4A9|nr:ribonuclease H2 subunit C-like [Corticium candelabrum]